MRPAIGEATFCSPTGEEAVAMTRCSECSNPVSSQAWECPACGHRSFAARWARALPTVIILVGLGWLLLTCSGRI